MLPLRQETRHSRLVHLTEEGKQKMRDLMASLLEESRLGQEAALLAYFDRCPTASLEVVGKKFPEALQRALAQKWVAVEEVERERLRRKVFAVRIAGPLPEGQRRLSPVARRIMETLERQGPAEDHRQVLEAARASLDNLRTLSRAGLIELDEAGRSVGWPGKRGAGIDERFPNADVETPPVLTPTVCRPQ